MPEYFGTPGPDNIVGTPGDDTFHAAGADTLSGLFGNDRFIITAASDGSKVFGGGGHDILDFSAIGNGVSVLERLSKPLYCRAP